MLVLKFPSPAPSPSSSSSETASAASSSSAESSIDPEENPETRQQELQEGDEGLPIFEEYMSQSVGEEESRLDRLEKLIGHLVESKKTETGSDTTAPTKADPENKKGTSSAKKSHQA